MNWDFFKAFGKQLADIWNGIKTYQKFTVIVAGTFLFGLLLFLTFQAASTRFAPLYPPGRLSMTDASDVKGYLDGAGTPYKIKGNSTILVAEQKIHSIRMDLAAVGIPKSNHGKGFELFDSNTWIKGEKELQVLEMRALKGQLERDISSFVNIKNARVILDIAPPRPFGGSLYKTKASVILDLMPGARLNNSELRSITFHVSGAVRGLQPNMIAISSTTGKLYQAIDPDGDYDMLRSAEVSLEERIKAKVDGMLGTVVGHDNYYSTVQVLMNRDKSSKERKIFSGEIDGTNLGDAVLMSITESGMQLSESEKANIGTPGTNTEAIAGAVVGSGEDILKRKENRSQQYRQMAVPMDYVKTRTSPGKLESISIGVLIDKTITVDSDSSIPASDLVDGKRNTEDLEKDVQSQLNIILLGYNVKVEAAVDFVEFDKTEVNELATEETWGNALDIGTKVGTGLFILLTVIGMFWTFNRFWKRHMSQPPNLEEEEEENFDFVEEPSLMEIEAMVESIKSRFHSDSHPIIETLREWLADDLKPHS